MRGDIHKGSCLWDCKGRLACICRNLVFPGNSISYKKKCMIMRGQCIYFALV